MKDAHIIIFCGQSNMQGQSDELSECCEVKQAFEYKLLTDTLVALKNPVGEDIRYDELEGERFTEKSDQRRWLADHVLGSACYGHTNLVPSFCRAYIRETGTNVVAVHAAKGSTEIKDWLPDSEGYRAVVTKATAAIKKAKMSFCVKHISLVWLQGESDAIASNNREYYKEKLKILAESLKKDIGIECFGVIRVGAFTNDSRDTEIIEAQNEICREDPFFVMLTEVALDLNKTPCMMNPNCRGHYSAKGLETLGDTAGDALGKVFKT